MKTLHSIFLMVAAVAMLTLCAPVYSSTQDDSIESSARQSYVFKTHLKDDDIEIESKDGVVTLSGVVANEFHKSMAQETVAGLAGVKSVDNMLELKEENPAEMSDAWISTKVKTMLLFHRNVSSMTEVDTTDGIVTLKGEAENQAQKDLTTEYAQDVDGVKEVKNEMTVAKTSKKTLDTVGETIEDASITTHVKMSLLYHRSTSALKTKVETNNGVVILTGEAKNTAEKDLVTKLVKDIKGVIRVKNQMTVK